MCRKLIYLFCLILVMGFALTHTVSAVDKDLKGWWKFNEGTGTTVEDSSGNGNTGTIVTGPTWTTDGKIGGAMQFNASGYIDCGSGQSLAIGDAVSMTAWIKVNVLARDHKVGGNANNTAPAYGGYKMGVYTNNRVEFEIRTASNATSVNRTTAGGTAFQTGVWYPRHGRLSPRLPVETEVLPAQPLMSTETVPRPTDLRKYRRVRAAVRMIGVSFILNSTGVRQTRHLPVSYSCRLTMIRC